MFSFKFSVFLRKDEVKGNEHLVHQISIVVHTCVSKFADRVHDELSESSLQRNTLVIEIINFPFFIRSIEEVVTP